MAPASINFYLEAVTTILPGYYLFLLFTILMQYGVQKRPWAHMMGLVIQHSPLGAAHRPKLSEKATVELYYVSYFRELWIVSWFRLCPSGWNPLGFD